VFAEEFAAFLRVAQEYTDLSGKEKAEE